MNEATQVVPIVFGLNKYNNHCYKFPSVIQYALDSNEEEQKVIGESAFTNLIQSNYGDSSIVSKIKTELRETSGYIINGRPKKSLVIVADILQKIKQLAEKQAKRNFNRLILTHPAQYESTKQELMTSAAHLCGFEEVILLEEPKAAAYAFLDKFKLQPGNGAIVFDYGGGTIDIAYLMLTEDAPIFKFAPVSQSKCGGEYIDLLLHNFIISRTDPSCREVSPALLDTCSRMKVNFSESEREVIVYNGKAFMFDLALFNRIISKKVDVAISLLKEVVKRCNSCDLPIDFVFLNGGSSRLRLVTESISQVIPSAKLLKYDDVGDDLAVSIGAMLYHKLSSEKYSARNEETTSDKGEVKIKNDVLDKIRKQFNEAIKRSN
jgi:molecular chaperone DnaK (HSP70)